MNPKRHAPIPIIDNLEHIGNPFKQIIYPYKPSVDEKVNENRRDYEYVLKFLYSYNGSTATFNSYRRELERLLQWVWRIENRSIIDLKREDIEDFIRFCIKPPVTWIGLKNVSRFFNRGDGLRSPNPQWRPFVVNTSKTQHSDGSKVLREQYQPSQAAIKATFATLSSFYLFLLQEAQISANPVTLIKQKNKFIRKDQIKPPVRRISNLQWDYVLETAELMAIEKPEEHERTLFIMNCLFGMYLRISELVADERSTPVMGDFRKDIDDNWWFYVVGKGNKNRAITVSNVLLKSLKRYRLSLGLPVLPSVEEQIPLIRKIKGSGAITSTRQIRFIVQNCFDIAYDHMKTDGLEVDANALKEATVHWLRHTAISEDVKNRPREHVRDDAGHATMATTDRYIDSDMRERHASGRRKKMKEI